jgi:hypothetical protein
LIPVHDDRRHGELVDKFSDRNRNVVGVPVVVPAGARVSELMEVGSRFGVLPTPLLMIIGLNDTITPA